MDQALVALLLGSAVLAAIIAGLLNLLGDKLRDQWTESRESKARAAQKELERNAFQKQTLLDLKVALDALTTANVDAFVYLLNSSAGQPDLGFAPLPAELQERRTAARDRVRLLRGQVLDESVRTLVDDGIAKSATFAIRPSKGEAHETMAEGNRLLGEAINRCDEIIRGL